MSETADADVNSTSVERNDNGQMSAAVGSKSRRTEYRYDKYGNVSEILYSDGTSESFEYNAYGELLEKTGDTENHFLYTGEYYDGTSNLYYLRARYMNPSTGTFISMDTYEGSIYDPDTLHKYLYANGNPVKYNDPTGNFSAVAMAAGMAINDCITTTYNIHLMGLVAGLGNMAVNSILGEQGIGLVNSFFEGYQSGVWTAGILYLTAAISVKLFAIVAFGMSATDTIMSFVLLVASVNEKNTKGILIFGTLMVLSIVDLYQVHNLYGTITITGDKGSVTVVVDDTDNITHEYFQDSTGRWHRPNGQFASNEEIGGSQSVSDNPNGLHGNSLLNTNTNYGYVLVDKDSKEILKFGETIHPNTRYSQTFLKEHNAEMIILEEGSKIDYIIGNMI